MIPPRDLSKPATTSEEGWCAFYAGQSRRHCPHNREAVRTAWLAGYDAAEECFANE